MTRLTVPPLQKSAAAAYLAWGVLHLAIGSTLLAIRLFGPADAFADQGIPADTSAHANALIMQNNVSLLAGALVVVGVALAYGWRGYVNGVWVLAGVTTLFWFELLVFELIPGHLPWSTGVAPMVAWIVANGLGILAWRRRSTEQRSGSGAAAT